MLDTIREYGLERLAASGEEAATRRAHAAYYLVLAEEGATPGATAIQSEWLDLFEVEHDNLGAALDWLTQTGNAEWGLASGLGALLRFWESREHFAEGRDRLAKVLKLEGAAAPTRPRARIAICRRRSGGRAGRLRICLHTDRRKPGDRAAS